MKISAKQVVIRPLERGDVQSLFELRIRNREFLKHFEPIQPDSHFTLEGQREVIERIITKWGQGTGYGFGIFLRETNDLIGRVNLSNVVRAAWLNCTIGYFLDQALNGRGLMTEALHLAVQFAFKEAGLHRVQAAVMPGNAASIKVVEKVGFRYEGLAKYYLKINGNWEDHNIYSITKEYWT